MTGTIRDAIVRSIDNFDLDMMAYGLGDELADSIERAIHEWLQSQRDTIAGAVLRLSLDNAGRRCVPQLMRDYRPVADAVLSVLVVE
jgi:hypothetical protein